MDGSPMKVIVYNGTRYTCALSDRFRRHTTEELDAIRQTAARPGKGGGIRVAIRVYTDTDLDLENCILDGEGRLSVATELGLPPAKVPFYYEPEQGTESAYELAKTLNDCRRHDDPEAVRKRRLGQVAEKRAEGKSIRAIAEELDIDPKQVRRDLASGGDSVPTLQPETVTGKDGKTYPASRHDSEEDRLVAEQAKADAIEAAQEAELAKELEADNPEPLDNSLPQPSIDAGRKNGAAPWMVPGGKPVDPDHPFADELKKLTAVAASVTAKLRALPRDHPVVQALIDFGSRIRVELGKQKPKHLPFLDFSSDLIDGDQKKEGKLTFVALRQVRRILRKYGPMKRYVAGSAIQDFINNAEGDE